MAVGDTDRHDVADAEGLSVAEELRQGDGERLGEPEGDFDAECERDVDVDAVGVINELYDCPGVMIVGVTELVLQSDAKGL